MSPSRYWTIGYAQQADADFQAFQALQGSNGVHECHRLLILQMACEKLCKAYLITTGSPADSLQSSHGYIANPLPVLLRAEIELWPAYQRRRRELLVACRHLAREIELLNPSIDRDGQRPDNCEYPWLDSSGEVISPLTWTFASTQLLLHPSGKSLLKLIRFAIDRILKAHLE